MLQRRMYLNALSILFMPVHSNQEERAAATDEAVAINGCTPTKTCPNKDRLCMIFSDCYTPHVTNVEPKTGILDDVIKINGSYSITLINMMHTYCT